MVAWRLLLAAPVTAILVAQAPAKASLGLTPAEVDGILQDIGGVVPFLKKDFSTAKVFEGKGASRMKAISTMPSMTWRLKSRTDPGWNSIRT